MDIYHKQTWLKSKFVQPVETIFAGAKRLTVMLIKQLLFVVNIFPKLSETFILDQITWFLNKGFEVSILSRLRPEDIVPQDEIVHKDVINYHLVQRTFYFRDEVKSRKHKYMVSPRLANELAKTDVLVAHFADEPTEIAMQLALITSVPLVFFAYAREIFVDPDVTAIRRRAEVARSIIVNTFFNKQYLIGLLGTDLASKISIVRTGVDLKRFCPERTNTLQSDNKTIVLSAGRFVEKKGFEYTLRAFAIVREQFDNVDLRIVGDGKLKARLIRLIDRLRLGESVQLLGSLEINELRAEMEAADIFILPSVTASNNDREGLPVTLLQASAMCLPVISTFHTGIPEGVVNDKSGFLVPEKDVEALADRLELLVRDKTLRRTMGASGREHIRENFDMSVENEKLLHLLTHLQP